MAQAATATAPKGAGHYGAGELKTVYQRYWTIGFGIAVVVHGGTDEHDGRTEQVLATATSRTGATQMYFAMARWLWCPRRGNGKIE